MPSRKRTSHRPGAERPQIIKVQDTKEITDVCRRALGAVVGDRHLGFNERRRARNTFVYSMTGSETSTGLARDVYPVVPLLRKTYTSYWLGTVLEFKFEEGYFRLMSASLIVFRGDAFDPNKRPILRAEWDALTDEDTSEHAQPHWHVYRSSVDEDSDVPYETSGDSEGQESQNTRFHFAMCSKWLEEADVHQEKLDEMGKLITWLESCIRYTRRQIELLPV